jgi:broad specificity phosphatase PhoE
MIKYIIARHGKTVANTEHRHLTRSDSPLTEGGKQEAHSIGEYLQESIASGKPFGGIDKIYYSRKPDDQTTWRVEDTLDIFTKYIPNIPAEGTDLMWEQNMGDYEKMTKEEVEAINAGFTAKREKDRWNVRAPNGENYKDVLERVKKLIKKIEHDFSGQDATVMLLGHRGVDRTIIWYLLGLSEEKLSDISVPTDSLYYIDEERNAYLIKDNEMKRADF